jgi:hypothetical protein
VPAGHAGVEQRGLTSGLVAAGFGSGAALFAPLATFLIDAYGVLAAFKILGTAYLMLIPVLSLFMKEVHEGDYAYAFVIAAFLSLLGIILTLSLVLTNVAPSQRETNASRPKP